MGTDNAKKELESLGIKCIGGEDDIPGFVLNNKQVVNEQLDEYELDPDVGAVILCKDELVNFTKLSITSLYA
jgi:hypothetical protein